MSASAMATDLIALDVAVAKLCDLPVVYRKGQPAFELKFSPEGPAHEFDLDAGLMWLYFCPSTCWDDGGPIIERQKISISVRSVDGRTNDDYWEAKCGRLKGVGPTPLIAAMWAFVKAKSNASYGEGETDLANAQADAPPDHFGDNLSIATCIAPSRQAKPSSESASTEDR